MTELKERNTVILNGLNLNLDKPDDVDSSSIVPISNNEISSFTEQYKVRLKNDPEVIRLKNEVCVTNPTEVLSFGEKATSEINKISDGLLNSLKAVNQEDAGEVLVQLTKIMNKFSTEEIKAIATNKEPSFIQKMFNKVKNSIEDVLSKYDSMSAEVDKVYMILKKYEIDIKNDTQTLSALYNSNIDFYGILEKHIVAGELILEELVNNYIPEYERRKNESEDGMALNDYNVLMQCKTMWEERIYDLKLAEQVSLQSLPMIQQMQMGNFELMKTISASFIVTLPIFKQCIINAVILKRQQLMAKNIEAIRQTTNEMIIKNAQNTSKQGVLMAKMAGQGAIDIDKLEESSSIIMKGIEETKKQQLENKNQRTIGEKRLEELKYKTLTQKGDLLEKSQNINNNISGSSTNNSRLRL